MTTSDEGAIMTAGELALQYYQGSYLTPAYEDASVADAMHPGVLQCPADATLTDAARMMAARHVHCVVIEAPAGKWLLVSDLDVIRAALDDGAASAVSAARPPLTVTTDQSLPSAARLMADHGVAHLLVLASEGRPVGVLSSLDVAGILAWGRG